jgi:hypothetical protein
VQQGQGVPWVSAGQHVYAGLRQTQHMGAMVLNLWSSKHIKQDTLAAQLWFQSCSSHTALQESQAGCGVVIPTGTHVELLFV